MKRYRQDSNRANLALLVVIFAVFIALTALNVLAQEWETPPSVKYINKDSPIDSAEVEDAIDRVVWSWRSRIPKMDIKYVGMTLGPIENAVITYKWLGIVDHFDLTGTLFAKGAEQKSVYLDSGRIARSVIYLNVGYFQNGLGACEMLVFSHELGHSLGAKHSSNPNDIMYYAPAHCRQSPTDADVRLTGNIPNTCYTEMTKDFDLFIPEIQGKEAYLKYNGGYVWTIEYLADKIPRPCAGSSYNWTSGELRLDVKGRDDSYTAVFQLIDNDKFKLIYAEAL